MGFCFACGPILFFQDKALAPGITSRFILFQGRNSSVVPRPKRRRTREHRISKRNPNINYSYQDKGNLEQSEANESIITTTRPNHYHPASHFLLQTHPTSSNLEGVFCPLERRAAPEVSSSQESRSQHDSHSTGDQSFPGLSRHAVCAARDKRRGRARRVDNLCQDVPISTIIHGLLLGSSGRESRCRWGRSGR